MQVAHSVTALLLRGSCLDICMVRDIWISPPLWWYMTGWVGRGKYGGVFSQRKEPGSKKEDTFSLGFIPIPPGIIDFFFSCVNFEGETLDALKVITKSSAPSLLQRGCWGWAHLLYELYHLCHDTTAWRAMNDVWHFTDEARGPL